MKIELSKNKSVKNLGVETDENLNWKDQTDDIATKLIIANTMLYKIINYVSFNTLKVI